MSESSEVKRGVFFDAGSLVRAQSSRITDRLGEVMIRQGRVSREQLDDASHFIKSGKKLGEILVELKIVDQEEIEPFVRAQLTDIACSVLIEPPRRLTFSNLSEVEAVVSPPLSVADILMEAARRTPHIGERLAQLKGETRRLGFAKNPLLRFQEVHLSPEEGYILSRIDGSERVQDIFALSPLDEEQTARTLVGLLEAGIVQPEGEAAPKIEKQKPHSPASVERSSVAAVSKEDPRAEIPQLYEFFQDKDHWEVLGLSRGASADEIRRAFYERAPRFHPDRYRQIEDSAFQEKVAYLFRRVSDAYTTLSEAASAADYEKLVEMEKVYEEQSWSNPQPSGEAASELAELARSRHPQEAKALFLRGKRAYETGDYWTAIQLCQQAIEFVSDQAEYYYVLALALSHNPKWLHDAERNLKIAINLDPWKAQYLVSLGNIYKKAGMDMRASRAYEQAQAVDPTVSLPTDES